MSIEGLFNLHKVPFLLRNPSALFVRCCSVVFTGVNVGVSLEVEPPSIIFRNNNTRRSHICAKSPQLSISYSLTPRLLPVPNT